MARTKGLSRTAHTSVGQGLGQSSADKNLKQRDLFLERQKVKERNEMRSAAGILWAFLLKSVAIKYPWTYHKTTHAGRDP
ncbi:hypothetical protein WOLCODRAFT_159288 [Wolfiporia cocos MD-104 SS10]|uniref:Uncharacterized protein n=1 Tax=Wolfiporia cocos (strain MD-104) TaxID=742152 RepID=A0A2H3JPN5_WOLCO|nr:hypothetical protein WOLCODRAFT_159288 [Wolfiporia cocos MD-104 SS10]